MPDRLPEEAAQALMRLRSRLDRDCYGWWDPETPWNLRNRQRRVGFYALDAYYDGEQRLEQIGLAVPDDLRQFTTIVAWPGTYVDAIAERQVVEGFRLAGQPETDDGLWAIWQANDMDSESPLARVDAKVFGRSYYCVGTNTDDADIPLISVESPLQMSHEWSNRRRRTTAAARFYSEDNGPRRVPKATLYLDDITYWLTLGDGGWELEEDPDAHGRPCPVVPLVNGQRAHHRYGRSMMGRVISLTDAAARALTNAQVATEVMALPQRWAAGMTAADFKDPATGEQLTAWESYFGAVWATANKDAKFGQFDAANLSNFTGIVDHYAQQVAGTTGLPMRYLGQMSTNPPSAEAIKSDEARMVLTCEAQNSAEAGTLERVMRLVQWWRTGEDDPSLASMETVHRDPATPTIAQAADAAVKLHTAGIISTRQARRDLGYSPVQIANMEADDADEAAALGAAGVKAIQSAAAGAPMMSQPPVDMTQNAPAGGA